MEQYFGRYRIIKHLATGGMAEIYLALAEGPSGFSKLVVLKKILPHLSTNEDFVKMFIDEATIAASLNHPNIVQVFDFGQENGLYYITMEYINGLDLRQLIVQHIKKKTQFDIAIASAIIEQVASALYYAHTKRDLSGNPMRIIHRDVTPKNILISKEGVVKLTDFGIAKAKSRLTQTQSGIIKGKFQYMAPEQIMTPNLVDHRADLFALGLVFREMLTLKKTFSGDSEPEILGQILNQDPEPVKNIRPDLPPCLNTWFEKTLAKFPQSRFSNARELIRALRDCVDKRADSMDISSYIQELVTIPSNPVVVESHQHEDKQEEELTQAAPQNIQQAVENEKTIAMEQVEHPTIITEQSQHPGMERTIPYDKSNHSETKNPIIYKLIGLLFIIALLGGGVYEFLSMKHTEQQINTNSKVKHIHTVIPKIQSRIPVKLPGVIFKRRTMVNSFTFVKVEHKKRKKSHKYPGILSLNVIPWGYVWVDGKKFGLAPINNIKLSSRTHTIKVTNQKKSKVIHIKIPSRKRIFVLIDLLHDKWTKQLKGSIK